MVEGFFLTRKETLEHEVNWLKREISKSPKGSVVACKVNGKYRWYHQKKKSGGGYQRSYINAKNNELAKRLAQKAYFRRMLLDRENELECISDYISKRKVTRYDAMLEYDSPYRELLLNSEWAMEQYNRNPSHPENLVVKAPKGEFVRSKSEALIANALFDLGIQYRYECELELSGEVVYPDFTIKDKKSGKIILWEHFGKMDDPDYFAKTIRKIALYLKNGYIPGVNLIMTFETKKEPFVTDDVQRAIMQNLIKIS